MTQQPEMADSEQDPLTGTDGETPWELLDPEEQTSLLIDYGQYLDQLPPTCSLEEKNARFVRWLAERNIKYSL